MEASNPLHVVHTTSSSLTTTQSSSAQPGLVSSAAFPAPQVSAMMHLQQLNLQQTLLLQQYALSQQPVSKTVKSPAEVAAARAAEISKQLELTGAAEKKTSERSKSRSTSKSASRSPSRSKSKSRSPSQSPIKRRRARSRSFSPIRYRRDYYPSYRSRDHYGYRGHNYRSYYRGNYDYSRYRYGRDYDYHYRRRSKSRGRRQSRTRSRSPRRDRSRGKRRSPTLSPPLNKRSHTGSPKGSRKVSMSSPLKRDRSRSQYTPQRSLSREVASSRSVSSERSRSEEKSGSRSRNVSQEKSVSRSRSVSQEKSVGRSRSPSREKSVCRSRSLSGEKSVSRSRSLSTRKSVGRSRSLSGEKFVGRSKSLSGEKSVGRSRSGSMDEFMGRSMSVSQERSMSRSKSASQERSMSRSRSVSQERSMGRSKSTSHEKSVSNHITDRSPLTELSEKSDKNQTPVRRRRQKKGLSVSRGGIIASSSSPTRSLSISLDKYKESPSEASAKKRDETPERGALDEHNDKAPTSLGKKYASEAEDSEVKRSFGHGSRVRKLTRSSDAISDSDSKSDESMDDWRDDLKKVVKGQGISAKGGEANRSEGRGEVKILETHMTERGSSWTVNVSDHVLKQKITPSASSVAHDNSTNAIGESLGIDDDGYGHIVGSADELDESLEPVPPLEQPKEVCKGYEEELIFEGPQPPADVAQEERKQMLEEGSNYAAKYFDAETRKLHWPIPDKRSEEIGTAGDNHNNIDNEDKHRHGSRSRDSKKHGAGSTKHERRRGKHKRHKKRHRDETSDEDTERARKRHKRRHKRRSDHGHKERKKRRHKHKSRLSLVSAEDSSSDGEVEVRSTSGKRKRAFKRRKASKRDVSQSSTSSTSLD